MICDECKQNQAVMHYVSIVNGKKTEQNLCQDCSSKLGMKSFSPFSLGDLFPHAVQSSAAQTRCDSCGTTLAEFKRTGMLGCPQCYNNLRVGVEPILRQMQKGFEHTGRTPIGFEAAKLPKPGETTPDAPLVSEYDLVNQQMKEAAARENFEEAAKLRDKLKELRNNKTKGE